MLGRRKRPSQPSADRTDVIEGIVTEHEAGLLRYVTRILNNAHEAQDIVQKTFIKLSQAWQDGTKPSPQLRAWLYRVAHNEAVSHVRHESRLRVLHTRADEHQHTVTCPDGIHCTPQDRERARLVMQHTHRLKPAERQILLLRLEEGLSYKEIGAITGRTVGNVGCLLHHAVQKLTLALKQSGVTP